MICHLRSVQPEELDGWEQRHHGKEPKNWPNCCAKEIKECMRESFPNICVVAVGCAIPVTSCECKRSPGVLCRLETFMRASVGQKVSSLARMHMHYDVSAEVIQMVNYL